MRNGSKKPGVDPESAGVSKGRRHNVRAPAPGPTRGRADDTDLHDQPASPSPASLPETSAPAPKKAPKNDETPER